MVISQLHGQERMMEHEMFLRTLPAWIFSHSCTQLWVASVSQPKKDCEMWGFSYGFVRPFCSFETWCQICIFQTSSYCVVVEKWLMSSIELGQTICPKLITFSNNQASKINWRVHCYVWVLNRIVILENPVHAVYWHRFQRQNSWFCSFPNLASVGFCAPSVRKAVTSGFCGFLWKELHRIKQFNMVRTWKLYWAF